MLEREQGAIVNVASINAFLPDPNVIDSVTAASPRPSRANVTGAQYVIDGGMIRTL
ncbi:MAG TPA: hypothetical protein VNT03_08605 [Baekduia sp.]|nr:hypothetical protein [Baekduia sp.]